MRDINRLNSFYDILRDLHKECFPDWRFGQLMLNFLGWIQHNKGRDPFYIEENEMLALLKEYVRKD